MSSRKERKKKKIILIFVSCIVFVIGYFILNTISKIYDVPLGMTFHVIFGCTLMATSAVYIGYTVNILFFKKKEKKKRSKVIFLDDNDNNKKID